MHSSAGSSLLGVPLVSPASCRTPAARGAAVSPVCVATPTRPPSTRPAKLSKVLKAFRFFLFFAAGNRSSNAQPAGIHEPQAFRCTSLLGQGLV